MADLLADGGDFQGSVTVNGVPLYARVEGRAGGPFVALVNSLATDHRMWDAQVEALAPRFRVLRYDARGHGNSAAPPGPYTMDMLVDDLLALLEHFDASRAYVAGVSLGGLTAMAAAFRRSPRLAGIIPCACRADMPPEFAQGIEARNALVREKGMGAIADVMVERWFTAPTRAAAPSYLETIRQMIRNTSTAGFIACAEAIKNSGIRARVHEIGLPALFVIGDQDAAFPVDLMRAMQQEVPASDLVVIEGAGHLVNVEQPHAFNAALTGFIDRQGA